VSKITRREFIHISALAAAGVTLAACAKTTAPTATTAPKAAEATATPAPTAAEATATPKPAEQPAGNEAPSVAAKVSAGTLPPLQERLPANPFVDGPGVLVNADDMEYEVGKYGGGPFRSVTDYEGDWIIRDAIMDNFIVTPAHYPTPIMPNIAESWEVSDDLMKFTFTLRKGLKWSDGEPVSTEDVRFGWEDALMDTDITPVLGSGWRSGGKPGADPMVLTIVDDYTFTTEFTAPYGRFVRNMGVGALWGAYMELMKPFHYLKAFHATYTSTADMKAALDAEGLNEDEWPRLFTAKDIPWYNIEYARAVGFPNLGPWLRQESPTELIVVDRNPYHYKVDPEGKQLPYVDVFESSIVQASANIPMKVIAGDVNMLRDRVPMDQVGLLKDNEAAGGYTVNLDMTLHNAPIALFINYNNEDENWQQVVLQQPFRQAIAYSINFQEILDVLYLGLGKVNPWMPQEFEPAKAEEYFDQCGLGEKDADGYRLGPDGKPFEFFIEFQEQSAEWPRFVELIQSHLEAVGLKTPIKLIAGDLWTERRDANQLYASIDWLDDCNWPYLMVDYMPTDRIGWGQLWNTYLNTNGEQGIAPPDWILEIYDIYAEMVAVVPGTQRAEAAEERFANWFLTNRPMFQAGRDIPNVQILSPDFGNIAKKGRASACLFGAEHIFYRS
jgi:peptide/nickel transport system substrate-binding protein